MSAFCVQILEVQPKNVELKQGLPYVFYFILVLKSTTVQCGAYGFVLMFFLKLFVKKIGRNVRVSKHKLLVSA